MTDPVVSIVHAWSGALTRTARRLAGHIRRCCGGL